MATKTVVTLLCDCPHDTETAAAGTHRLQFGASVWEIDLCDADLKDLERKVAPFTEHGRRIGKRPGKRIDRQAATERRAWLREEGGFPDLPERGPLPAAAREKLAARFPLG